jgi:hypothetical protein
MYLSVAEVAVSAMNVSKGYTRPQTVTTGQLSVTEELFKAALCPIRLFLSNI